MKMAIFDYADTYIESVEAFCKTVNVKRICFYDTWLSVVYD